MLWVLRQNRLHTEHGQTLEAPRESRLRLDGLDHGLDSRPVDLGLKVRPARDRRETDVLFRGKLQRRSLLSSVAGGEFLGAVEPVTLEGRAVDQRHRRMHPGPLADPLYKSFLHGLCK